MVLAVRNHGGRGEGQHRSPAHGSDHSLANQADSASDVAEAKEAEKAEEAKEVSLYTCTV